MNSELISIIVPMYFEEAVAEECYNRLTTVAKENNLNYELIFVNDGSTDKTLDILEELATRDCHVKVISFSRNFGHQIAVTAGIDKARGDAAVIIDADLQDPPEIIPQMINLWKEGNDVVYGKRKARDGESSFKLITAKLFYRFLGKMSSVKIPMDTGDFRLIDRKVIEAFKNMPEHNRFLRGMCSWIGFKQVALEYDRKERFAGETKYPLKKMIKFALDGIFSLSSKPLKLIEYLGSLTILVSLLIFAYLLIGSSLGLRGSYSNSTLILTTVTLIGGLQILSIGLVGEYIARIYDESKGRPLYIIDKEINLDSGVVKPMYVVDKNNDSYENLQKTVSWIRKEIRGNKKYGTK